MFDQFKRLRITQGIVIMAIVFSVFGLYSHTIKSHFSGTDITVIRGNESLRSFSNLSQIFSQEFAKGYGARQRFYRPLQMAGYMIEYWFWGLDAQGYHVVNILFHIGTSLGLFWLVKLLFDNMVLAALSALLFSVHPIHAQTVMGLSNQGNLLAAVLLLASFIGYIKATLGGDKADYMMCLLCYLAALLSYEASVLFPVLLLAYHFFLKRRLQVREFMVITCFSLAYIVLRVCGFSRDFSAPYQDTLMFFASSTDFLRYLLVPFGFYRAYQPALTQGLLNSQVLLGVAFYALTLSYIIKRRRDSAISTYFGMWFCVAMLAFFTSFLFAPFNSGGWFYLATMGFFVILARCLTFVMDDKKQPIAAVILIVFLVGFYSYSTLRQIQYLKSPQKFYQAEIPF